MTRRSFLSSLGLGLLALPVAIKAATTNRIYVKDGTITCLQVDETCRGYCRRHWIDTYEHWINRGATREKAYSKACHVWPDSLRNEEHPLWWELNPGKGWFMDTEWKPPVS